MNTNNGQKEEKGGFWSALSGIFRGGASSMGGGASSGLGTAGGLFATKAGIVGMVLGGATIAAGVGVVYNFVGSSSKPVYSPELFQNSYYEEESAAAGLERSQSRDRSSASASTLDIFRDQAKKDGLSGLAAESNGEAKSEAADQAAAAADAPADGAAAAEAPAAPGASGGDAGGGARLKSAPGFGGGSKGGGGSSASAMPRMQGGGNGMAGGIGGQFASMYKAPAGKGNDGRTSAMGGSLAARTNGSPKYAVPNFNKKGAHAQAKFASKLGSKGAYSADAAGARTSATDAFSGETTGTGDVAGGDAGAGMGGAGISNGAGLKGNDPSLNSNKTDIPKVTDNPENVSPWKKYEDGAMYGLLGAMAGIILIKLFGKIAKSSIPWLSWVGYGLAIAALVATLLVCAYVIYCGIKLMTGDPDNSEGKGVWAGQGMMGGVYIAAGLMMAIKAWDAFAGLEKGDGTSPDTSEGAKAGDTIKNPTKPPLGADFQLGEIFKGM